jgi:predicted acylesterase/phospholipase RssA
MVADSKPRIGLALAGGGPLGAVYELGALSALAEALAGVDFNALDVYVGVSAGGFIAAGLANGIAPRKLAAMFVESETSDEPLSPSMLLKPAFREYARRAASVPPLLLNSIWHYVSNPLSANFFESFQRLSRAIPTGVFNNAGIDAFLTRLFSAPGRSNDFRELPHKLFLVATDLDTGASVAFGAPGYDHVPISAAVQASAALPGLFPPVAIENRYYVDGALKKTLHASVALDHGAELLLCINPLVPFDSQLAASRGAPRDHKLVEGGLPVVLAQTFRAIIHSRMQVGMSKYESQYRGADVVLFEPNRDDADMFFTNMFSYSSRRRLSEHAYQKTRAELLRRYDELQPILARHGVSIRLDVLRDPTRRLLGVSRRRRRPASQALDAARELAATLSDLQVLVERRLRPLRHAA